MPLPAPPARAAHAVRPRSSGDRPPRCTTAEAASSRPPPRARRPRTPSSRNSSASSCDPNVQKQCTTRTLNPRRQERPIAPADQAVLRQVAAQARHVVASVVEQDQQSAARSEDPPDLGGLGRGGATERRPEAGQDVGRRVGRVDPRRSVRRGERDPRTELGKLSSADPIGTIEQQHVASPGRTQCVEHPRDLALDIEDAGQSTRPARPRGRSVDLPQVAEYDRKRRPPTRRLRPPAAPPRTGRPAPGPPSRRGSTPARRHRTRAGRAARAARRHPPARPRTGPAGRPARRRR